MYTRSPGNALPSSPPSDQLSTDMVSPRCALPESGEIFSTSISTSVKKGFSSIMTSIDSAFKTNSDDASDTVSLR